MAACCCQNCVAQSVKRQKLVRHCTCSLCCYCHFTGAVTVQVLVSTATYSVSWQAACVLFWLAGASERYATPAHMAEL